MPPRKKPTNDDGKPNDDAADDEGENFDAERINAIITKRVNRALANLDERIAGVVGDALKPHLEKLSGGAQGKGEEPPKSTGNADSDARLAAVEAQSKKLEEQLKLERDGRKADAVAALRTKAASELKSALGGKVRPGTLDMLAGHLMREGGPVKVGKDGKVTITVTDEEGDAVELDLAKGVERFLGTDEGKEFLPARGVGGSGADSGTGKSRGGNGGQQAPLQEASELNNVFRGLLGEAPRG